MPSQVDAATLVRVMRHVDLCFLNGCQSEELALELVRAGVRDVICWATLANDEAASLLAVAFWQHLVGGDSTSDAFEKAAQHVLLQTWLPPGASRYVPKFAFADPE